MENKINIAELLKDCPKGMELDCLVFEDVTLYKIDTDIENEFPIRIKTKNDYFLDLTKYGTYSNVEEAKCVIFPKGKTTWEGFVPPCKFKDGDIIFTHTNTSKGLLEYSWISIFKEYRNNRCACYVCLCLSDLKLDYDKWEDMLLCELCEIEESRLATEEEKRKLFDAIKENGCYWNAETKTLEKLIKLKFHEGQWITKGYVGGQITSIDYNYHCYRIADFMGGIDTSIPFTLQDNYHLWTIQDAKGGDVLAAYECLVLFEKLDGLNIKCYCTYHFMNNPSFYVDTLQNKDAFHPATEEEKRKLFDAIKANGYRWNAETKTLEKLPKFEVGNKIEKYGGYRFTIAEVKDDYYLTKCGNKIPFDNQDDFSLVPNKFDITTLKEFDSRVLVRIDNCDLWRPALFGFVDKSSSVFYVLGGNSYSQCIPYDRNEHLRGTTNDCDDFYKTWE